ncbi:hypothetical protein PLICRDRAFT_180622 [Plicaturopsis crispa FD-325 SS-3]|uniref:Uncharacterized protein n=1 Tax=Plicaturopsis crispa FD-325 SS-3 TaxID=944288 RepID=A0A0C9T208_PLICR|nr:hypothetical protein PLICRDRAFT_180622 [Plicaturopsis crispa FD-325 SS-3]
MGTPRQRAPNADVCRPLAAHPHHAPATPMHTHLFNQLRQQRQRCTAPPPPPQSTPATTPTAGVDACTPPPSKPRRPSPSQRTHPPRHPQCHQIAYASAPIHRPRARPVHARSGARSHRGEMHHLSSASHPVSRRVAANAARPHRLGARPRDPTPSHYVAYGTRAPPSTARQPRTSALVRGEEGATGQEQQEEHTGGKTRGEHAGARRAMQARRCDEDRRCATACPSSRGAAPASPPSSSPPPSLCLPPPPSSHMYADQAYL